MYLYERWAKGSLLVNLSQIKAKSHVEDHCEHNV